MPAWPPGASRSTTIVRSPSEAPYTAAASPAGPAPTMTVSYSAADGLGAEPEELGDAAKLRPHDGLAVHDADHRAVVVGGERAAPALRGVRRVGHEPLEADLVPLQEAPQLGAGRVPAVAEDERPWRRLRGRDARQAVRAADPVRGQSPDLRRDVRRDGGECVIVVRLEPQDARRPGRAEPDREPRAECDRHLAEDVARLALADDALDAVHDLDRLDEPVEQPEEGALVRPRARRTRPGRA